MNKGTIKIPKEVTEALNRLEYNTLFHNRRVVRTYCNPITGNLENEEVPALSHFIAEGDQDDLSLLQYLTLIAMHAYDDNDEEIQKINEVCSEYLR